jgi:hypothetical protein
MMSGMMKTNPTSISLRAAAVLAAAFIVMAAPLCAQAPASAKPTPQPQSDPFIKKEAGSPVTKEPDSVCNVGMTLEIYSLNQSDAARLIGENEAGPVLHDHVRELVTNGKARLETVLGNVTKSGQRAVVELIDEVRYATLFEAASTADELPVPTAFETRNTGETFEWEPLLEADNRACHLNFVINEVHLRGFDDLRATQQKMAFAQPRFETEKITTTQTVRVGIMQFLGTLSAAPDFQAADVSKAGMEKGNPVQARLLFGRLDVVRIPTKPLAQVTQAGTLEQQLSFYSMDREAARAVLGEISKPGAVYSAVQPLLDRHEARLERLLVLKTQSGQRAVAEQIDEVRYLDKCSSKPDKKGSSSDNKSDKPSISPAELNVEFCTRNTGLTLEVEPVLASNSSLVDLSMVPQMVRLIGDLHAEGIASKYQRQPVFETRKVTTSLCATLGEQAFIGTFSQPEDTGVNGQKDTGLVWLGFIRVNLVQP